jgi:RimJ/RimL family protein N-acetyltransferase
MWAVERRSDGALIGRVGFLDPEGWPGCELGWLLARDTWGQGYALESARAALDHGRRELGLGELISLIRPDNQRSIVLAERLGAQRSGPIDFLGAITWLYRHAPVGGCAPSPAISGGGRRGRCRSGRGSRRRPVRWCARSRR